MKKIIILSVLVLTPAVAFAETAQNVLFRISDIIALATPIVVALALLYFFFGLAKYVLNAGDEEKKSEGRSIMIWGIIALFVMISVWSLVGLIGDTFNIGGGSQFITPPSVNTNVNTNPRINI